MQNFIEKIVRSSRTTDKEGLCIISGKLVWSVTVNIHLLNDDGNVFDAVFLASILALKNTRLPEVSMTRDKIRINDQKLKYLNVHHIPVCTTFYFMKDMPDLAVLDVNSKEERLATSRLSIVMNTYEDICGMTTLGSTEIDNSPDHLQLIAYMRIALKKAKEVTAIVRHKWDNRLKEFPLLDQSKPKPTEIRRKQEQAQSFIDALNQQAELNRKSHPSTEDREEMQLSEDEEIKERKIIELVKQHHMQEHDEREQQPSNTRDSTSRIEQNFKKALNDQSAERKNLLKERAAFHQERLAQIESQISDADLSSALKRKRNK